MSSDDVRRLVALLEGYSLIRIALLFGSLARNTATPESDLDLAVGAGRRLTTEERVELIGALASAFGRPVDLVDLASVGEPLIGQILQGGVRLLGSNREYAELLKRHLFAQADFVPYQKRILRERRRAWMGAGRAEAGVAAALPVPGVATPPTWRGTMMPRASLH